MAEIIKVYKENQPATRFIGKCYTDSDRINGSFGHKWGEWFQNGWFDDLEKLGKVENIENGHIGFMRSYPNFEYWIGVFLPPDTAVPSGYDYIDLDKVAAGVCWIKGKDEDSSIYGMHNECIKKLNENDMDILKAENGQMAYCFERYNCPRFTDKDKNGDVILDYGVYITE